MNFNLIHSIEQIDESGQGAEPVTLSDMKNYLRLEGFDQSGDFDFDDDLIEGMIISARESAEIYTGSSLISKTLKVALTNLCGRISLPGPVTGDVAITDKDGTEVSADDIEFIGTKFPDLKCPVAEDMVLIYPAGYTPETIPKRLKEAIMKEVAYRYEHRGEEFDDIGICKAAQVMAKQFVKTSAWA